METGTVNLSGVTIQDINTNVYALSGSTTARLFNFEMRRPYDDGGTDVTETFTLTGATVDTYRSGGRVFTILFDSGGTQSSPTTSNFQVTSTTFNDI